MMEEKRTNKHNFPKLVAMEFIIYYLVSFCPVGWAVEYTDGTSVERKDPLPNVSPDMTLNNLMMKFQ